MFGVCSTLVHWLVVWLPSIWHFPRYWVANHPNWQTHIFQRGGPTTNQVHHCESLWIPFFFGHFSESRYHVHQNSGRYQIARGSLLVSFTYIVFVLLESIRARAELGILSCSLSWQWKLSHSRCCFPLYRLSSCIFRYVWLVAGFWDLLCSTDFVLFHSFTMAWWSPYPAGGSALGGCGAKAVSWQDLGGTPVGGLTSLPCNTIYW